MERGVALTSRARLRSSHGEEDEPRFRDRERADWLTRLDVCPGWSGHCDRALLRHRVPLALAGRL
jgi:hypothetical protein